MADEAEEFLEKLLGNARTTAMIGNRVESTATVAKSSSFRGGNEISNLVDMGTGKLDLNQYSVGKSRDLPLDNAVGAINVVNKAKELSTLNDTILIRGLGDEATLEGVEKSIFSLEAAYEKVKLSRSQNGIIAFVKFYAAPLATEWLTRMGHTAMIDTYNCKLEYAIPRQGKGENEWICSQCNSSNFEQRTKCHVCKLPKLVSINHEVVANVGARDLGTIPCHLVLVRGIPENTPPSVVYDLVSEIVEPQRVLFVNQKSNHNFLGFGFIIFNSIREASKFLGVVNNTRYPRKVICDGRDLTMNFAHMGAFIPTKKGSSFIAIENANGECFKYWDESTYCERFPNPNTTKDLRQIVDIVSVAIQDSVKPQPIHAPAIILAKEAESSKISTKLQAQIEQWSRINEKLNEEIETSKANEAIPTNIEISHKFKDEERMACLLCKRQFTSIKVLDQHTELSRLHLSNLDSHRKELIAKSKQTKIRVEYPTQNGIPNNNIGHQMMEKMGWTKGQGLGADSSGIKKPIKLARRPDKLGLGN